VLIPSVSKVSQSAERKPQKDAAFHCLVSNNAGALKPTELPCHYVNSSRVSPLHIKGSKLSKDELPVCSL
jgi:hypothetical protein